MTVNELNIKKLGFGLMRLPTLPDGKIDIEQSKTMTDMFMRAGCTYFDTAWVYGGGASECAAKEILVDRYPRESFQLATKLFMKEGMTTVEEAEKMLATSLERTGAGYFDFYLLHSLNRDRVRYYDEHDMWGFIKRKKEEGVLRHVGFSFHDTADVLDKFLTDHPDMEFVQLQINYLDWENESIQSRACYEVARKHGMPIIVMEPVKGGNLANPPESIAKILKAANADASPSSWAIRFAASLPGVVTVLSGMSNVAQMADNLSYMTDFKPLEEGEKQVVDQVRKAFAEIPTIPCTACAYCMKDCPQNIAIFDTFRAVNNYRLYANLGASKSRYERATKEKGKASACIDCGQCEEVCPQRIAIRAELKAAAELFEN
ncbi:MAG: aldo/keto reductase [Clostridia bacterium]|nr:aldo/keto reductase [Clostridia bacterium]